VKKMNNVKNGSRFLKKNRKWKPWPPTKAVKTIFKPDSRFLEKTQGVEAVATN
jgi:hypothetical protein